MAAHAAAAPRIGLTEAPRHAFGLDLARASAVVSVLVAHGSLFYAEAFPAARYVLIVFGVLGVEIFFALSGFLVGRQLLLVAEGKASGWRFLQRRWWRTLPNYYLFLAVNAALAWWVVDRAAPDARFLVFAQSLVLPARGDFFPESWSLAIEEWFYLLAAGAFAIAAWRRASARALGMGLVAITVAWPLLRYGAQSWPEFPMDGGVRKVTLLRLDALAFGLGCAWFERYRAAAFDRLRSPGVLAAAVFLVALSAAALAMLASDLAFFAPARDNFTRALASVLFTAMPLAAALWLPWLSRWESWRSPLAHPVRKLSEWSYAIYLTHFPTLLVLLALWPVNQGSAGMLAARTLAWIVVAVVLAAVVYRWYEHPMTLRRPSL
ncbi:MAG TPA: acyltransferase family protein [Usitatibacter sp.]|nr:acyltransferase family protein [Usitatibacter sp.]